MITKHQQNSRVFLYCKFGSGQGQAQVKKPYPRPDPFSKRALYFAQSHFLGLFFCSNPHIFRMDLRRDGPPWTTLIWRKHKHNNNPIRTCRKNTPLQCSFPLQHCNLCQHQQLAEKENHYRVKREHFAHHERTVQKYLTTIDINLLSDQISLKLWRVAQFGQT